MLPELHRSLPDDEVLGAQLAFAGILVPVHDLSLPDAVFFLAALIDRLRVAHRSDVCCDVSSGPM